MFSLVQFIHDPLICFWLQTPLDVEFVKTTILAIYSLYIVQLLITVLVSK